VAGFCEFLVDQWWNHAAQGPIFFYTGNEGDITEFWNNTGFIFDIAPQFEALVIFAEHVCKTVPQCFFLHY
jgi:lysosomal Pro-X carboxypeptidase